MPEPNVLGERVLLSRRRAGLTQQELAVAVGVTTGTIARLEQGRTHHVSTKTLERMSRVLEVSADYLLGLSDRREGGLDVESGESANHLTPLHVTAVES